MRNRDTLIVAHAALAAVRTCGNATDEDVTEAVAIAIDEATARERERCRALCAEYEGERCDLYDAILERVPESFGMGGGQRPRLHPNHATVTVLFKPAEYLTGSGWVALPCSKCGEQIVAGDTFRQTEDGRIEHIPGVCLEAPR